MNILIYDNEITHQKPPMRLVKLSDGVQMEGHMICMHREVVACPQHRWSSIRAYFATSVRFTASRSNGRCISTDPNMHSGNSSSVFPSITKAICITI